MHVSLLAVTGLSPAVVTETVWALAMESPTNLPRSVGFITTVAGARVLESSLHTPRDDWGGRTVWQGLRETLRAGPGELIADVPAVISMPDSATGRTCALEDIRTPEENAAAAEFIFGRVWNVVRDRDRTLVASIAGGRKTMGALLHAAVSLIGREQDRLTHVLVDPPFDTEPAFFFPGQPGGRVMWRNGETFDPASVSVQLADVPFVPLRNRFQDLDGLPGTFEEVRRNFSRCLAQDAGAPAQIVIQYRSAADGVLVVDGVAIRVRSKALVILHFLLAAQKGNTIYPGQIEAAAGFPAWAAEEGGEALAFEVDADLIRHELSHLRSVLRKRACRWVPPVRSLDFPPFALQVER